MKTFMTSVFAFLIMLTINSYAAPAPFGLEMGKATISDAKARYALESHGKNPISQGENFDVVTKNIDFDGLQKLNITFDKEGKLVSLSATLSKGRFDDVVASMRRKYKLVKSEIPFVGNKSAEFQDGNTVIFIEAPHLSFSMTLMYIQTGFLEQVKQSINKDKQEKQKRENSQL